MAHQFIHAPIIKLSREKLKQAHSQNEPAMEAYNGENTEIVKNGKKE